MTVLAVILFGLVLLLMATVMLYAALSSPTFVLLVLTFVGYKVWRSNHV